MLRSEVFTAVTLKNYLTGNTLLSVIEPSRLCMIRGFHGDDYEESVFWVIETQFVPHRKNIKSLLQKPAG
jgi:hypothetical protein